MENKLNKIMSVFLGSNPSKTGSNSGKTLSKIHIVVN